MPNNTTKKTATTAAETTATAEKATKPMIMSKKQSGASSVGGALGSALKEICYFLTILFCALRACGVINWSWFWVMSPIFFSWVLALVCLGIIGLVTAIALKDD